MPYEILTAESWPIAASMLPFNGRPSSDGGPMRDASASEWAADLQQVVDVGFTAVDPLDGWVPFADLSPERFAEFRAVLADLGLTVPSVSMSSRRSVADGVNGEEIVRETHATLVRASELGAKILNIGFQRTLTEQQSSALWFWLEPGHRDSLDPATRSQAIARVRELGDHAADLGMQISLEIYEDTYIGTADLAVAFIEDVAHGSVGLNPDIGNLVRLHRPIEASRAMLDKTLPHANFWHIKNYLRDEDPVSGVVTSFPVPLVMGVIDYRYGIRRAVELGFRGPFVCEHYGSDGLGVAAINRDYIRDVLRTVVPTAEPRTPDQERGLL